MALDLWTGEDGVPGTLITVANSGGASGSPMSSLQTATGTTMTYSTEAGNGNVGLAFGRTSGSATFYVLRDMTAATTRSVTFMFMLDALPSQNMSLMWCRSGGNLQLGGISLSATNRLESRNALNVAINSATSPIEANVWYRVEMVMTAGTTTTNGSGKWQYFIGNNTTAVQSFPISGANFGTAGDVRYHRYGRTGDTSLATLYMDDLGMDNTAEYLGAVGTPAPFFVESQGVVWRIDLRGSGAANGGILSYPTPVKVSGPTLAFTEPEDGLFFFTQDATLDAVYTFTVNESGGSSTARNITVPKALTGSNSRGWFRWDTARNDWV